MKKSDINWAGLRRGTAIQYLKSAAILSCAVAGLATQAIAGSRTADLPDVCDRIAAPEANKLAFHVFAVGVQIYQWNGTNWIFVGPQATLYADANHRGQVGTHFGTPTGPAWQTTSGSMVIAQRVDGCTPDTTAIAWLLLRAISEGGNGILNGVSYVQRVNTVGGIAPSTPGSSVGQEQSVPYTSEYLFYRSTAKFYAQEDLVSDLPGVAQVQDTNLVNSWGVTFGGTGPFWVADNAKGKATLYAVTNVTDATDIVSKQSLEVNIPGKSPTGVVSNNKGGFNGDAFLFANLNGTISGWRGALGTNAETLATRAGAVYTGLTLATNSSGLLLLAANFAEGTIDVYATNASLVAQFADPHAPPGYAPFNVQSVNGIVFVMYAKRDAAEGDEDPGRGRGLIDVFDPQTGAFHRFATGTDAGGHLAQINAPWGIALAPLTFGPHAGELLVGNFGDGRILAFGPDGRFHGLLRGADEHPIQIEGLWGLTFGNDGRAGSADTLFFASGPLEESHGLFGGLKPASNQRSNEH